jgi:predicted RNase H-like HicB family nuclease
VTCTIVVAIGTVHEPSRTLGPMEFTAAIAHEGPWYVTRCLDVEVASQGETAEEALANLKEALELYFEDKVLPDSLEPPVIATLRLTA